MVHVGARSSQLAVYLMVRWRKILGAKKRRLTGDNDDGRDVRGAVTV